VGSKAQNVKIIVNPLQNFAPRSSAFKVTLPASKGPMCPFLLARDGYPTFSTDYAQRQECSPESQEASERKRLPSYG
jgi:hypothetical protein